jgi:hypothetical protein
MGCYEAWPAGKQASFARIQPFLVLANEVGCCIATSPVFSRFHYILAQASLEYLAFVYKG